MALRDGGTRTLPARAGVGLRAPHVAEVLAHPDSVAWVEVHPENYMGGGSAVRDLERLRMEIPLGLHAVGLSLGTAGPVDTRHLDRLAQLVERLEPAVVSEHLSWSTTDGAFLNHLLPLPLTEETLALTARHVDAVQTRLGRPILVENPASYLRFAHSSIPEAAFLAELARRTGCGLLCDVNNVYVSCRNLGLDAVAYLEALPAARVGEIHLAGHAVNDADGRPFLIDHHGAPVADAVWRLYGLALERFGAVPTLIEWDTDLPALHVLLGEAAKADHRLACILGDVGAVAA